MKTPKNSHQISSDGNSEWEAPVQVPETPMEEAMLQCVVEAKLFKAFNSFNKGIVKKGWHRVGVYDHTEDGWFPIVYALDEASPLSCLNIYLRGRARVVEREYPASEAFRIIVEWEFQKQSGDGWELLSNQSNHGDYPPVVMTK